MPRKRTAAVSFRSVRPLSARHMARLKADLSQAVCSSPWFDYCWLAALSGRVPVKRDLHLELDRVALYPPGGSRQAAHDCGRPTQMRRCVSCGGRWYPPQYLRGDGRCEDCHAATELPPELASTDAGTHRPSTCSPSAISFHQMAYNGRQILEQALLPEDPTALREQIDRYLATQPKRKRLKVKMGNNSK